MPNVLRLNQLSEQDARAMQIALLESMVEYWKDEREKLSDKDTPRWIDLTTIIGDLLETKNCIKNL